MHYISIYPTIVKSRCLSDGSFKIYIAVSYKNATRYIGTRFTVPSEKNFRNREVVNTPNAFTINRKLRDIVGEYLSAFDSIKNASILTCSQVTDILKNGNENPTLFSQVFKLWIESKHNIKPTTEKLYHAEYKTLVDYFGEEFDLQHLTAFEVNRLVKHLVSKISHTYTDMIMGMFAGVLSYAQRHKLVKYDVDPFIDFKRHSKVSRNVAVPVETLRELRDVKLQRHISAKRDFFMFSFYTCGMNPVDIMKLDISKSVIKFRRTKTDRRRSPEEFTEFTMTTEARAIADRSLEKDRLCLKGLETKVKDHLLNSVNRALHRIQRESLSYDGRIIIYSARKTFAQLAADIYVPDSVIEYCLGDVQSKSRVINYYRRITKDIADRHIRRVMDFVASDLTAEEFLAQEKSSETK